MAATRRRVAVNLSHFLQIFGFDVLTPISESRCAGSRPHCLHAFD